MAHKELVKYTSGCKRSKHDTINWREKGFYFWMPSQASLPLQELYDELFDACEVYREEDPETKAVIVTTHHVDTRADGFDAKATLLAKKTATCIEKYILKSALCLPSNYYLQIDTFIRESIDNEGWSLPYPPIWPSLIGMRLPTDP